MNRLNGTPDLLHGLNDRQRQVVLHEGGPLLVLAGPGSGKTRVITTHLAHRVLARGALPQRMVAITFTNRAATEMKERLNGTLEGRTVPIGTFHWLCSAFLRRYSSRLGFEREYRVLSPSEARGVLAEMLPLGLSLGVVAHAVGAVKNGAPLNAAAAEAVVAPEALRALIDSYAARLRARCALDLDDLLVNTASLLRADAELRARARARFDVLLVDEFQDTNPVQAEIVSLLAPNDNTVIAVGDDDQAIYGWRGAGAGNDLFHTAFPDRDVVVMNRSYRHTKMVLRAASSLIAHNAKRESKVLESDLPAGRLPLSFAGGDEVDEALWIAEEVHRLHADGVPRGDIAVLYRMNAQSRAIEDAFIHAGIPYQVQAGRRFYDLPEVKHVAAYLRTALDSGDDEAVALLVGSVPGIGKVRLERLIAAGAESSGGLVGVLSASEPPSAIPADVWQRVRAMGMRMSAVIALRNRGLMEVLGVAIDATIQDLEGVNREREDIQESGDELLTVARELDGGRGTVRGLIDHMSIYTDDTKSVEGVHLLSLHAAKGLEFSAVFITGLEEGVLPHRRALESDEEIAEERRLCYVGMTRARERLYLCHAHVRFLGGHAIIGGPSRFLAEIGNANMRTVVSKRASRAPRLVSVRPGECVRHQRWGIGTVVSVEGRGRDTLITVQFDTVGRQRLQLCHAPLSRETRREESGRVG
jgi:DNA helicase II / ATP-dependent DNA helicase PcrA